MNDRRGLVVHFGRRQYLIDGRALRVGRGDGNHVTIDDDDVSRQHAVIWGSGDRAYVRDLESRNGTFVNGRRIDGQHSLRVGDEVSIGRANLAVDARPAGAGWSADRPRPGGTVSPLLVVGLVALALIAALVLLQGSVGPTTTAQQAWRSAAAIWLPDVAAGGGSGTMIDSRGYLLTTFSAVEPVAGCPGPSHRVGVGISTEVRRAPEEIFRATVVCADRGADLALLRITATEGGGPLRNDLTFRAAVMGNADAVQVGERLTVIGYPRPDQPVRVIDGAVSGFVGVRTRTTLNAAFDPGVRGGMVVTGGGRVVGVASDSATRTFVPLDLAGGLLDRLPP